jgi:hypothetical protein
MIGNPQTLQALRRAVLAAAMLVAAARGVFADAPGYLFMDFRPSAAASAPELVRHPAAADAENVSRKAPPRAVCAVRGLDGSSDRGASCIEIPGWTVSQSDRSGHR